SLLRLSLDPEIKSTDTLPRRPQFRQSWLSSALAELKDELGESRFDRLVAALSLMCGIESFIVLHDVLRMTRRQASDVKRWAARLLLRAAIQETTDDRATISRSARPKGTKQKRRRAKRARSR